ncbi:MAG: collagen binding domain-containing protein, partial [Psychrobacillus psychrodurans]
MKKISFIALVFLLVLQSFIGPITTSANNDTSSAQGQSFTFGEVTVDEAGKASIPWIFVAGNEETEVQYTYQSELKLDAATSGTLTGNIGSYTISVDGLITVTIAPNQLEDVAGSISVEGVETVAPVEEDSITEPTVEEPVSEPVTEESKEETVPEEEKSVEELKEGLPVEEVKEEDSKVTSLNSIDPLAIGGVITENIITSVVMKNESGEDITVVRPDQGSKVQVDFAWGLPADHGYMDGATFTFDLPDKFKITTQLSGDLSGGWGTYLVTPEGKVTFTFNDQIEDTEVTDGYFMVWREFQEDKFSGGLEQKIDFQFSGILPITVHFNSKTNEKIKKSGSANKGMNASEIEWVIDFNKGENEIKNAILNDVIPAGITLNGKITLIELETDLKGNVTETTKTEEFDTFPINLPTINNAYRVKYKTTIDEPKDV